MSRRNPERRQHDRRSADSGNRSCGPLVNPYEPMRVLTDDHVAHLHSTALDLLAHDGIKVLLPEARTLFADAGASVDGEMVRLDPALVEQSLQSAPTEFTIRAPNPDRNVVVGGRNWQPANPHIRDGFTEPLTPCLEGGLPGPFRRYACERTDTV